MSSLGSSATDYTGVTETPGTRVSRHAASMAVSRYELVRRLAPGKRVLEVACGSGQGLGYVGANAARIVGGDITAALLTTAQAHYLGRVPLVRFDAHALRFAAATFDLVQIHEAIDYMADPRRVFQECRCALADGGTLVISSNMARLQPEPAVGPLSRSRRAQGGSPADVSFRRDLVWLPGRLANSARLCRFAHQAHSRALQSNSKNNGRESVLETRVLRTPIARAS